MTLRKSYKILAFLLIAIAMLIAGALLWDRTQGNRWFRLYGRVVDSKGNGIAGVTVKIQMERARFFVPPPMPFAGGGVSDWDYAQVVSDQNGNFTWLGHAEHCDITKLEKAGYLYEFGMFTSNGQWNYNHSHFDPHISGGNYIPPPAANPATLILTPLNDGATSTKVKIVP
ncbi:MAG: hypothetical protein M3O30_08280 [Planctomycetota bacterium]|nr:hypothetical protein [Planctomycetota bacterium]